MSEGRQEEVQEERQPPEGPGRRLRETREARGLSREDAAYELRLNERLVQRLEEDDYDNLPPAAFVTGYLRNYARLLELPEREIIERFEKAGAEPPELVPHGRDTQARSSDLSVRLVTWVVVIGLLVLVAAWWFSEGQPEEEAVPGTPEEELMPEGEPEPPAGDAGLETPVEPPPVDEQAEPPLPGEEPAGEAPAPPAIEEPTVEEPAVEAPAPEPTPPAAADMQGLQLRLVFSADSWVEIADANGRQLAHGLINQGRELTLEGEPPYHVFLGYAPGVTLYYRGEPFDHSGFVRRNETARFQVGSAGESPRAGSQ